MLRLYEYDISFETDIKKLRIQKTEYNIHELIRKVRIEYPDARGFIVLSKTEVRKLKMEATNLSVNSSKF